MKLNTGAKEIQQVNQTAKASGPYVRHVSTQPGRFIFPVFYLLHLFRT